MMINNKLEILKQNIRNFGKVAVAFSGGVDSTFLLRVSHDVLEENVIAISSYSGLFPKKWVFLNFLRKEQKYIQSYVN